MHARSLLLLLLGLALGCTDVDAPAGQCRYDSDCSEGQVCAGTYCRAGCRTDRDCPTGQRCGESDRLNVSTCIPMVIDAQCNRASDCPAGLVCLDGACRPQCQRDYDCQVINPFFSCVSGTCALSCATGTSDCDGDPRNGCETSTTDNAAHCGTCTTTCAGAPNAMGTCTASTCGRQCNAGFADCDGNAANGCEVTLATDATHCGTCATSCPSAANADAACTASMCGRQCRAGFADCDGSAANGCEVTLATDAAHCGTCTNACSFAHAAAVCAAGTCGLGTCAAGFGNCDGMAANGCETPIDTGTNCGACGTVCAAGTVCSAGTCNSICTGGTTYCGESCVNTATSLTHCGMCGRVCPAPANAVATCAASLCGFTCNAGYRNNGEGCTPIAAGRLVSPASLSTLNGNNNIVFQVARAPGADGTRIEICRDRACTMVVDSENGTGDTVTLTRPLSAGLYFWRAYGRVGTNTGLTPSAQTWEVVVPNRARNAEVGSGNLSDFNGDGYTDLAIGEPGGRRVLVFHGSATSLPDAPTRIIFDGTITGGFGNHTTAGDFNGDGFADLAVSSDSSLVYIFPGSATGLALTPTTRTGSTGYGGVIQAASDLNRDGYADLVVSYRCFGGCRSGADVYYGSPTGLAATPSVNLPATDDFMTFDNIAAVGRLTTDSLYESLVMLGVGKGSYDILVFRGSSTGFGTTPVQTFSAPRYTYNLAAANDLDGDGQGDVVISTQGFKAASVISALRGLPAGLSTTPSLTLSDEGNLGGLVAGIGDVDNDGFADVMGSNGNGVVRIFRGGGGTSPVISLGPRIDAPAPTEGTRFNYFGGLFPTAGDFNRDGFSDFVIGAEPDFDGDCDYDVFVYPGRMVVTTGTFTPVRTYRYANGNCGGVAGR